MQAEDLPRQRRAAPDPTAAREFLASGFCAGSVACLARRVHASHLAQMCSLTSGVNYPSLGMSYLEFGIQEQLSGSAPR